MWRCPANWRQHPPMISISRERKRNMSALFLARLAYWIFRKLCHTEMPFKRSSVILAQRNRARDYTRCCGHRNDKWLTPAGDVCRSRDAAVVISIQYSKESQSTAYVLHFLKKHTDATTNSNDTCGLCDITMKKQENKSHEDVEKVRDHTEKIKSFGAGELSHHTTRP